MPLPFYRAAAGALAEKWEAEGLFFGNPAPGAVFLHVWRRACGKAPQAFGKTRSLARRLLARLACSEKGSFSAWLSYASYHGYFFRGRWEALFRREEIPEDEWMPWLTARCRTAFGVGRDPLSVYEKWTAAAGIPRRKRLLLGMTKEEDGGNRILHESFPACGNRDKRED